MLGMKIGIISLLLEIKSCMIKINQSLITPPLNEQRSSYSNKQVMYKHNNDIKCLFCNLLHNSKYFDVVTQPDMRKGILMKELFQEKPSWWLNVSQI